ncbi:MAG: efflux RND transporter permease subunit [Candidatus Peribacteria bacterium]|nr:MAG: efflux RND transporter permease subunit [Candidatus Peribacteria bacterium]
MSAGSIVGDVEDHDIRVVYDEYQDSVTPQQVGDVVIQTSRGAIAVRDILSYDLVESVASYQREDGKLVVSVESAVETGIPSSVVQAKLMEYIKTYDFPDGVSYSAGGESAENADLMTAMGTGALIAIFLIYAILVLQFNSMRQPFLVIFSIFMSLLGVNTGLWLT